MKPMRVATCGVTASSHPSEMADEVTVVINLRRDDTHPHPAAQFSNEVHNAIVEFLDDQVRREETEG